MTHSAGGDAGQVLLHEVYASQFRVHAITLIRFGYKRLNAASFATADEDDITGELVREMKSGAQDPSSPDWVDHYEIREQSRQNVVGKRGKGRPILDIEIERHERGDRLRLGFEAKRLGRGEAIGGYLGPRGLGAFLSGYYPTTHGEAGMLGYVQEQTNDEWAAKLRQELSREPSKHQIADGGELQALDAGFPTPAFRSSHTDTESKPLLVIHVLLSFAS